VLWETACQTKVLLLASSQASCHQQNFFQKIIFSCQLHCVCFVQRWFVYCAMDLWIASGTGNLVIVNSAVLFFPITAVWWPPLVQFFAGLANILFVFSWHITQFLHKCHCLRTVVQELGLTGCKRTPKSFELSNVCAKSQKVWAKKPISKIFSNTLLVPRAPNV